MPRPHFRFESEWRVAAPPRVAARALTDLEHYPSWWPQVLAVADLGEDRAWLVCRSRLPYELDLVLTAVRREPPMLEVAVDGDLVGWVRIGLTPVEGGTRVQYDQEVTVPGAKGWLAQGVRPVLRWNHDHMMRGMREGLAQRLDELGDGTGTGLGKPSSDS